MMTPSFAKTKSHEILRAYGIEINESLPEIERREELRPQDARSVAIRCVVLSHVIGIGFGGNAARLKGLLEEFELYQHASPREQGLLSSQDPTEQETVDATWLTECVLSLDGFLVWWFWIHFANVMTTLRVIFRAPPLTQRTSSLRLHFARSMRFISRLIFITGCIGQPGTPG